MSEFTDIVHRVAEIGEHVIEFIEGTGTLSLNGRPITRDELLQILSALNEAAQALGLVLAA